ncbi:MAG: hypothetical protein ACXAB7_15790 [Candidatus Kariarchaeaceae archaeon]
MKIKGKLFGILSILIMLLLLLSPSLSGGQTDDAYWQTNSIQNFFTQATYTHPILTKFFSNSVYDVISGRDQGTLLIQENLGDNATHFILDSFEFGYFDTTYERSAPATLDINYDGLDDLLIGDKQGNIHLLLRTMNTSFVTNNSLIQGISVGNYAKPAGIDLNLDGLLDLVIGDGDGILTAFVNTGTKETPIWTKNTELFQRVPIGGHAAPFPIDPDGDGNYDLVIGTENLGILYVRNTIKPGDELPSWDSVPFSNSGNPFGKIDFLDTNFMTPFLIDLDEDGFLDIIVGSKSGGIESFLNKGYDLLEVKNVNPTFYTFTNILIFLFILLAVSGGTAFLVIQRSKVRGTPLYLMVLHSIGIAPFEYQFPEGFTLETDKMLAGGALVGIQNVMSEITGSPDLKAMESGENKIIITRSQMETSDSEIQILVWATADDPNIRKCAEQLGQYIVKHHAKSIDGGAFDEFFDQLVKAKIMEIFEDWLE